jgi:hypothetical protein
MKYCGRATKKRSRPVKRHNIAQHLQYRFVQEYPRSFSKLIFLQIFTPIGLVAACFSMSQKVVPFIMNFRSFVISTLVMLAMANMIRLLFCASSRKHGWRRKITALVEALHLHEKAHRFWTRDYRIGFMMRRRPNSNERNRDTSNIELSTIRV